MVRGDGLSLKLLQQQQQPISFSLPGTSNWAEDYFSITAGLGFVFEPDMLWKNPNVATKRDKSRNLRDQMESIFKRDWNSEYAERLTLS
jgi:hypothetical protein